jgi:hypothetical protein
LKRTPLFTFLFPSEPRDFPYRRTARSILRALHILTAGTLVGGHIFAQPDDVLMPWLIGAVLTGTLLLCTDLHASFAVLIEVRGLTSIGKLILLCLVAVHPDAAVPLLVIVVFAGAVGSHLPKRYRHKMVLLRNRVVTDGRSG